MSGELTTPINGKNAGLVRETTMASFRADVLNESARLPVLVHFYAPSVAESLVMRPMLDKLTQAAGGKIKLAHMDVEAHPQIASQLGVQSLPCVYAFQRAQPVDGFTGSLPETQLRGFFERLIGPMASESADLLAQAHELAAANQWDAAHEIYTAVLAQEPGNGAARAGLAKLRLGANDIAGARALLDDAPTEARRDAAFIATLAALEIAAQAANVGDTGDLERQIKADPKNYSARFDLALALNANDKRDEAADALLEIIRLDRKWEEDGARKQLIQFFESWGPMDAATQTARRKLSTLLFS